MNMIKMLNHFGNTLSLLIVEDEKDVNDNLAELLSMFFKVVDQAYDGEEALMKFRKNRYDIILSDISMPKLNGIVMSRKIKALNPNQVIIIVSAHSDTKHMIELIDLHIDKFILKPFDKNTLLYKLLKISEQIAYQKEFAEFYKRKRQETLKQLKIIEDNSDSIKENNSNTENENYHSSHTKETAEDFLDDVSNDNLLWQTFKDDIAELLQLSEEFSEDMDRMDLDGFIEDIRDSVVHILHGYILIFSTLDQMLRMTEVLEQLIEFLEELDVSNLSDEQQKKMKLLSFINDDITRFLQTVFVYKDTVDIYYLEDSLESSILQLKNDVLGVAIEDDDEELELF